MKRILVIDDNEIFRLIFAEWLKSEGFYPIMAADGHEGRQLAYTYQPDVIFCDVKMEIMDGIEVLTRFHNDPAITHIPFFFLSSEVSLKWYLLKLPGVTGFISKQAEFHELRHLLDTFSTQESTSHKSM